MELRISIEEYVLFGFALANRINRRNLSDNYCHRESSDALGRGVCARARVQQLSDQPRIFPTRVLSLCDDDRLGTERAR